VEGRRAWVCVCVCVCVCGCVLFVGGGGRELASCAGSRSEDLVRASVISSHGASGGIVIK
jgi:hypothetical protein